MAAKLVAATLAAVVALWIGGTLPGRLSLCALVGGPVAGFLAPDLWLARAAARRAQAVSRELPAALDLLGAATAAGLPPASAVQAVARDCRGELPEELGTLARQLELGVPLEGALDGLRRRLPTAGVEALAGALLRASRHGSPLAPTLALQARDARAARRRRLAEEAARAGPKIQLAVALLLVPSVLLLITAALATALLGGGMAGLVP